MASDASLVDNKKPSSSKKVAKVIHVAFKSFLAESALDDAKAAESSAIAALAQFKSSHGDSSSAPATSSRRGKSAPRNYRAFANPASRPTVKDREHSSLRDTINAEKAEFIKASGKLDSFKNGKLDSFKNGKLITKEDFFNHGIKVIRPIFDDYKRLFVDDGGGCV